MGSMGMEGTNGWMPGIDAAGQGLGPGIGLGWISGSEKTHALRLTKITVAYLVITGILIANDFSRFVIDYNIFRNIRV